MTEIAFVALSIPAAFFVALFGTLALLAAL